MQSMIDNQIPLDALERIRFTPNWGLKEAPAKQFLIMNAGYLLEQITQFFVQELQAQQVDKLRVGLAREMSQQKDQARGLRIEISEDELHFVAADVVLRAQGRDLFVRHNVQARTWLSYLRYIAFAALTVLFWSLAYTVFLHATDTYHSLVQAYADKYCEDPKVGAEMLMTGLRPDLEGGDAETEEPITMIEIARIDPKLFIFNMGGPPSLIALGVGALVYFCMRPLLHPLCRFMRWPTPEDYNNFATGHYAWVDGMLSYVLLQYFGIGQDQIQPING